MKKNIRLRFMTIILPIDIIRTAASRVLYILSLLEKENKYNTIILKGTSCCKNQKSTEQR